MFAPAPGEAHGSKVRFDASDTGAEVFRKELAALGRAMLIARMFDRFVASFPASPSGHPAGEPWRDSRLVVAAGYEELSGRFAGCSFESGLYRLHNAFSGPRAESLIASAFPEFAGRSCPFGYDWLGRQFALDSRRADGSESLVLLMEPGTGEASEVPLSLEAFHEQLAELREPALAAGFFAEWVKGNPTAVPLSTAQCVGYRVALFLGGSDTVANLEVIDLEVYWELGGQLRRGVRRLPVGSSVREISVQPPPPG